MLRRLVIHLVTQIPQHVICRAAALEHVAAAGKVGRKLGHVAPPRLPAQERRADTGAGERGAGRQEPYLRVVGIGMENQMGHTLGHIDVGHLLQVTPILVPRV